MVVSEKRIEDLKGLKFNVPSYQRGYRWTEHEVTTLLKTSIHIVNKTEIISTVCSP